MSLKLRLTIMSFLQFAVWGAYLTSMGNYLASIGLASKIGLFYAMQGIVSIFMPAVMGIGFVLALTEEEAEKAIAIAETHGEKAYTIGRVVKGEGVLFNGTHDGSLV